mgnify:CR=1 FL=1
MNFLPWVKQQTVHGYLSVKDLQHIFEATTTGTIGTRQEMEGECVEAYEHLLNRSHVNIRSRHQPELTVKVKEERSCLKSIRKKNSLPRLVSFIVKELEKYGFIWIKIAPPLHVCYKHI